MEKHINAQFQRWEIISKTYTKFISMPKENMNPGYINMKMRLIQQTWSNIEEKHFMLFETYEEEQLNAFEYISEGTFFEWEEEYTNANLAMLERLRELKNKIESIEDSFPGSANKYKPVEVKIPAIKIPTFNGSYLEWNSFYDQFESLIDNNDGLSDVQKLHYLKMHVVGEAANLLRHISVIGNNYAHAWEKLKRRYSNKRIIVNAYLQRLMAIRNCNHESANCYKPYMYPILLISSSILPYQHS